MTQAKHAVQQWYETEFLPWQSKAKTYQQEKAAQLNKLRNHTAELQHMVGLLLGGETKRAVLGWNSLGLEPALAEIVLTKDGETLTLRTKGGVAQVLSIDELINGLQQLLQEKQTTPSPDQASGS